MSLSIIVVSAGRPTLADTLMIIADQLEPGDELLVDVNNDAPWGHKARNRMMPRAHGTALLFMDDDDAYLPGALAAVREAVDKNPVRIHMFKMLYYGDVLWRTQDVACGNVSTQMFAVPNDPSIVGKAKWGDRYEGDFDFISEAVLYAGEPIWHNEIIAKYRALPGSV